MDALGGFTGRWRGWRAAAVAACLALPVLASAGGARPAGAFQEVAPGVYVREGKLEDWGPRNLGRVSNQGVVVGEKCVAVIDTSGTPADGQVLRDAIREVTDRPVCHVINTHAHPDHVLGNEAFARVQGEPKFIGHTRLPAALQARGPYYLNALKRDFGRGHGEATLVAPDTLVEDSLELDLGNRSLRLKAWKTAHTDSDLTVLDEKTGVLFLGDLLFVDHVPVLDGSLKGWLAAMSELRDWKITLAVPGHGAPTRDLQAALDAQQRYLLNLRSKTLEAIKANVSLARAVDRIEPDTAQWKLLQTFHKRNVTAAYAELEWED